MTGTITNPRGARKVTPLFPTSCANSVVENLERAMSEIALVLMAVKHEADQSEHDLSPIINGVERVSDTISRALESAESVPAAA